MNSELLWGVVSKLLLVLAGALFLRLLAITYKTAGPYVREIDRGSRLWSTGLFVLWLGVMGVAVLARVARTVLHTLYEASADLGELWLGRRALEVESGLQSNLH